MQPKELRIRNFLTITDAEICFDQNGTMVFDGSKQQDSTTVNEGENHELVLEALTWALSGKTARGLSGADLLCREDGKDCTVQLDCGDYSIHRTFRQEAPHHSLRLFHYDPAPFCAAITVKELTRDTVEETQELITNLLDLSVSPLK